MNVAAAITELADMTVRELRQRYAKVFGETTNSRHKDFLRRRIIWRMQVRVEGGLSGKAHARARELADEAELRMSAPGRRSISAEKPGMQRDKRLPMPGAIITREYKGQTIEVRILHDGFEYCGEVYRTLSAVTKAVTGKHWNGYHFFGLGKRGNSNGRKEQ